MKQYVYSKVSARTNTSEQHQSVNPDLRYWVELRLNTGIRTLYFCDLSSYTDAIAEFGLTPLVDYGIFQYKMPLL